MAHNIRSIQQTIRRNLVEITNEPTQLKVDPRVARDTRLHRIVASKLQRAKEGTRFLY